jgi:hypothetical protein
MAFYLQSLMGSLLRAADLKDPQNPALEDIMDVLDEVNDFAAHLRPPSDLTEKEEGKKDDQNNDSHDHDVDKMANGSDIDDYNGVNNHLEEHHKENGGKDEKDRKNSLHGFAESLMKMMMLMKKYPVLNKRLPWMIEEIKSTQGKPLKDGKYREIEGLLDLSSEPTNTSINIESSRSPSLAEASNSASESSGRSEAWTRSLFGVEGVSGRHTVAMPSTADLSILASPRKGRM